MVEKYIAHLTLFLPISMQNLPFYNLYANVDGDSIGSSYATHIAGTLFKDFEELWSAEQLEVLINTLSYKDLRSCLTIKINDFNNAMSEIKDGAEEVGHSTIHTLIDLIKEKIWPDQIPG